MGYFLSDLNESGPGVRSVYFLTIITLLVVKNELHNQALVDIHSSWSFFLNCDLDLETLGVRLSPYESSVN